MKNHFDPALLRFLGLAVVPAWLLGMGIMVLLHAPSTMPLMNFVSGIVGFVGVACGAAAFSSATAKRPLLVAFAVLAFVALTFVDAGLDGVFRWVRLGPIRLHPAAVGTPLLLFALVHLWMQQKTIFVLSLGALGLALHVLQPDAGQATAFGAAMMTLAAFPDKRKGARILLLLSSTMGVAASWMQPDPLHGVPLVEDVVPQALATHVLLGIAAIVALALLPITTLVQTYHSRKNHFAFLQGAMLTAYFTASIVVVAIGEFPTPVLGFGASPILGAIFGIGLLQRSATTEPSASPLTGPEQ